MPGLATDLFDYQLPPELIAQTPAARRDESRLLVVDRKRRCVEHRRFSDLPEYFGSGDLLIRNNAAVLPARLLLKRPTGGQVECFLLREVEAGSWRCLLKPGRKLPVGARFSDEAGTVEGEIVARHADGSGTVRFTTTGGETVTAMANRLGQVPLPPYIAREDRGARDADLERYQTVYADRARQVAVAAPTAGLHFTPGVLEELKRRGVEWADLTLHVGLGTFRPISTDTVDAHPIHRELYEVPAEARVKLADGRYARRIAVGTTSVRAVEDYLANGGSTETGRREVGPYKEASIFIYPPYSFRGVDALITNFHLPRSTLLCLVAAFLAPGSTEGIVWLKEIYAEAIRERYRFLSYGDAMLIL